MSQLAGANLEKALARGGLGQLARQKDHAGRVFASGRQLDADVRGHITQESIRELDQYPGAVAGVFLGAARASMAQVLENPDAITHNPMRLVARDVHYKAHAAGLVLVGWIVEPLPLWKLLPRCNLAHRWSREVWSFSF